MGDGLSSDDPVRVPGDVDPADHPSDQVLEELLGAFGAEPVVPVGDAPRPRVVIGGDDLPDAVYLDDEALDGSNRIVIEDDTYTEEHAGGRPRGTSAGVDPRMRARRIAVRRAEGRKRLRLALAIGGVVVLVVGVLAVLGSSLFAIDVVDVEGAVYSDPDVVTEIVGSLQGEPILTADLRGAEERLEALAWVREARVTMDFPHRVLIEIAERDPLAHFRGADGRYRVIDVTGVVLDVIDGKPVDYVEITGTGPDLPSGADAGTVYRGAARLANALPPSLRPRVTSLGVTESGEITLLLDARPGADGTPAAPIGVVFGTPDDYQDKLVALVNELARHGRGEITSIDVSTGSPVVS